MKKNTEGAKTHLMQALQSMPEDFALSDVRFHIRTAIQKIEHVEKKRERREQVTRQNQLVDAYSNPNQVIDPRKLLENLDQMIEDEKKRLEEIQKRKTQKVDTDDFDDLQTILG